MQVHPVILSGGSGTRLWPLSRELYPKQLLPLAGERTMLQATVERLPGWDNLAAPLVVCNEDHRFLVAEQLREAGYDPDAIILEPVGRNTAPALTLAALRVAATAGDGVLLVMPADHVIGDEARFHQALAQARTRAAEGALVTFGIVPTAAETGYGYIRRGAAAEGEAFVVERFVEKPDAATARQYVDSGEYLWNSGMFVLRASVWLRALEQANPGMLACCREALEGAREDADFVRVDAERFAACPADSIDYAVMEPASEGGLGSDAPPVLVVPLDARWSDVGAWPALWELRAKDGEDNVVQGDVYTSGVSRSLLHSEHRFVAAVGVRDMVVVETADAVLVAHKDAAQNIKGVVEWLRHHDRAERLSHRRVFRPWGTYECVDAADRYKVKRITVNPGAALSLQMHYHRAEHWVVVKGTAKVTCGEETILLSENQSTFIPLGTAHRLENPGNIPLEMIEVQSGSYLGEDDIVRFEDHYGR